MILAHELKYYLGLMFSGWNMGLIFVILIFPLCSEYYVKISAYSYL
jgi:hypothetical protein